MVDIFYRGATLVVATKEKKELTLDIDSSSVSLDGFDVTHPGEYEKSGILLEVKDYKETLFYKFFIAGYHLVMVNSDNFDLSEDILSFFGDVDILIIKGTKLGVKIYESIEAKLVIPYGEEKEIFLNSLGQNKEAVDIHKIKGEINGENTEFVNLN